MRLLIIGPYPLNQSKIRNGVEAVVVYLLNGLKKINDLDIEIVSCSQEVTKEEIRQIDGVKVHFLPSLRRLGNITLNMMDHYRLRKKIQELRPDIVHIHNHVNYPYVFTEPLCPIVITVHGIVFKEDSYRAGILNFIRRIARVRLEMLALKKASDVVCVTPYVRRVISPLTRANLHIIENPVNDSFFQISPGGQSQSILFAGSITRRKNLLGLLKVVNLLKAKIQDVELRVAGAVEEPSYYGVLKDYLHKNKLERNVSFLGHLSEEILIKEYQKCAVVASFSYEETSGMVIQQGMAAGKAIVASQIEGFAEILRDNETGFLIDVNDIEGFAKATYRLLTDDKLRRGLGRAARQIAKERFSQDFVAYLSYSLYKKIVHGRQG